jgi:RNA-directed DNA polymerase
MDPANMRRAWKRVKANKGAPGSDGMTLEDFPTFARSHWSAVRQDLLDGTYQPKPVRRVSIPKPNGGERWLGIPSVVDRVIQQAIGQVLTPIFDPGFSKSSFGFRPGRSAHGAVRQVQRTIGEGYRFAVDLDLEKFFDRVNHDVLMARVARKVRDKCLLGLIGRYLRAGVLVGHLIQATELGTPQGGPLSPLLANILLDDLDKELERRGYRFARYADDLLILVKSPRTGERVKASVTRYLTRELKLAVTLSPGAKGVNRRLPEGAAPGRVRNSEQKSRVVKTNDCEFLGFTFRGTKLRWSDQAFADFKHNVRKLTGRSWGVSMAYRLDRLTRYAG